MRDDIVRLECVFQRECEMEKRGHDNDYLLRDEVKREVKTRNISPDSGFYYKIPLRRNGVLKLIVCPPCGRLKI